MLGAMGYELDSQARERLRKLYAEMSEAELFDLARHVENLTDTAREVLHGEMSSRRIEAALEVPESGTRWASDAFAEKTWDAPPISPTILGSAPELELNATEVASLQPGEVLLRTFHDAFEMSKACESLEAAEVGFRVQDVSTPSDGVQGYAPVALNLIVAKQDRERAMEVLRKEMGLFPLQEVAEADAVVDDGTVAAVGYFGRREEAEEIARVLEAAQLWHRVSANPEGSADSEDAWLLEVREVDLARAGDVVEKALGMA